MEKSVFMLDSGAEISLLKKFCLPEDLNPCPFKLMLKGVCGGRSLFTFWASQNLKLEKLVLFFIQWIMMTNLNTMEF